MKKLIPMAVATVCVATVAFASMNQPATANVASNDQAVVDTLIPQTEENSTQFPTTEQNQAQTPIEADTTQPTQEDTTEPAQAWPSSGDSTTSTDTTSWK